MGHTLFFRLISRGGDLEIPLFFYRIIADDNREIKKIIKVLKKRDTTPRFSAYKYRLTIKSQVLN